MISLLIVIVFVLSLPFRIIWCLLSLLLGLVSFKPHYRKGKKRYNKRHPVYVHHKKGDDYEVVSLTHKGGMNNIPLSKNPNPNDTNSSYIRPYRFSATENDLESEKIEGWKKPTFKERKNINGLPMSDVNPNKAYLRDKDEYS